MAKISFVAADGSETVVEAEENSSVMTAALANGVTGIVAECGGSMICATCHCYVDPAWQERVGPRSDGEAEMLECATSEVRDNSRLSCQIRVTPELDGLRVHLPETQV